MAGRGPSLYGRRRQARHLGGCWGSVPGPLGSAGGRGCAQLGMAPAGGSRLPATGMLEWGAASGHLGFV